MSQGITVAAYPERVVGNDPEPLGVAFLQGPPFTLMISLTLSNFSCLSLRLEILKFFLKIEQIFKFLCRSEIHHLQFDDAEVWSMLLHTFWYTSH